MIVFCEEKTRTAEEIEYNVFISNTVIGTLSHKIGSHTWTVRNVLNSEWRTGDLIACSRDLFFPKLEEEIIYVDKAGKQIQFPS
jgi:hypothetical protein